MTRICVIGGGPTGLSVLCWFAKMLRQGRKIPEIVCYEKQQNCGGLWNYTWRTGSDEHGEHVHGSMYKYLWANAPKECVEFPHYTFDSHFGRTISSFPPREVLFDYLQGRWNQEDIKKYIKLNHVARDVSYNNATDDFTVSVKSLDENKVLEDEKFDYAVIASGHYSVPNIPTFKGIETFSGRVMHSHDLRDASEFNGKRILIIGASLSAEDIALQCLKYGAKSIICTYRRAPMKVMWGWTWPSQIQERPLIQKFEDNTAHFKDGSTAEVDAVIMCTGYLHSYPFLRENLRLISKNTLYPPNLYKGIVWQGGGNNKLVYGGVQDNCYTFTMFDIIGLWIAKYIQGDISLPDSSTMMADSKHWIKRLKSEVKSVNGVIDYQTEYVMDLVQDCGEDYPYDINVSSLLKQWAQHKKEDVLTYRDQSFTSKFSGTKSPIHHTPFMKAMDDSYESFMR